MDILCFIGQEMMAYEYKKGTEKYKNMKNGLKIHHLLVH